MFTVLEIVRKTTDFFSGKGIESPRLNAELIVGHVLGLKRMQLYLQFERPLAEPELERIRPLVRRRGQREPVQYVLGETEFCGRRLKVDRRALIPRPETEQLVALAMARLESPPSSALDLGTGSGSIAIALAAAYPDGAITGVDSSDDALSLARENVEASGFAPRVALLKSHWFDQIPADKVFSLIVANPPYLSEADLEAAAPEVRSFEPRQALVSGGTEGLDDLLAIVKGATQRLVPGGLLALETGISHHGTLVRQAREAGFTDVASQQDLSGRDRYVLARLQA